MAAASPKNALQSLAEHPLDQADPVDQPCGEEPEICEIQMAYSRLLSLLAKIGFALLLVTFALYMSGILGNYVPRQNLPQYWGLPLEEYLEFTGVKTGWSWLREVHHGDLLNLLPMAFLASITAICLVPAIVRFFRNREPLQGIIAILEVAVLLLAASGLLSLKGY